MQFKLWVLLKPNRYGIVTILGMRSIIQLISGFVNPLKQAIPLF